MAHSECLHKLTGGNFGNAIYFFFLNSSRIRGISNDMSRVLPFGLLFFFLSLTTTTFSLTKFMECHRVADGAQFMSLRFIQFLPVAVPFLFYFNTIRLEWANYNPLATIHNSKNVTAEGNLILLNSWTLVQVVVDSSASTVIFAEGVQCPKIH